MQSSPVLGANRAAGKRLCAAIAHSFNNYGRAISLHQQAWGGASRRTLDNTSIRASLGLRTEASA